MKSILAAKNGLTIALFSFSHDYSFIVSGSEDKYVYIWSTYHDLSKFTSVRRDRNDFWEGIKGSCAVHRMRNIADTTTCLISLFHFDQTDVKM